MSDILLLESDTVLAQSYRDALEQAGHTVHWQHDAQKALEIPDKYPIKLVVLELQLAGHNGVEFLHEFRSYADWDHIPVMLHTLVHRESPGSGQGVWSQLGIVEYLYKPRTSLKQLVRAVDKALTASTA